MPLQHLAVFAFDNDLEDPLGRADSDENGVYSIIYSTERLRQAEKRSADLIVRVFTSDGEYLGQSQISPNAPADAQQDVVIEHAAVLELTEYEQHLATLALAPRLSNRKLGELNEEEIAALAERTGIDKTHVRFLVLSARLADSVDLPNDILYGLLRRDLPPEPEALFTQPPEALHQALKSAISLKIIPEAHVESLGDILHRIGRHRYLYLPLTQVAPVIGLKADSALYERLARHGIRTLFDIRNSGGIGHLAGLRVADRQVVESEGAGKGTAVLSRRQDSSRWGSYAELGQRLSSLRRRRMVRRTAATASAIQPNNQAVLTLEAHARLSLLPTDIAVNTQLVESGFASVDEIVEMPYETFLTTVKDRIPEDTATPVYKAAAVQARYLNDVLTSHRVSAANGQTQSISALLSTALSSVCGCKDCDTATSPLAYLFDLLV